MNEIIHLKKELSFAIKRNNTDKILSVKGRLVTLANRHKANGKIALSSTAEFILNNTK